MYFLSLGLSLVGNSMAGVALPVLVLVSTGDPLMAGVVAVATGVSTVLSGIFSAAWIDSVDKRYVSAIGDLVSAAGVGIVAASAFVGEPSVTVFVIGAFIGGLGDMPAWNSREAMVYAVARSSGRPLDTLVGIREATSGLAIVIGPTAAGILMGWLDARSVLTVTVCTSLAAAATVMLGPVARSTPEQHEPGRLGVRAFVDSATMIAGDGYAVLRRIIGINVVSVGIVGVLQGLIIPVVFTLSGREHLSGYALAFIGLGLLLGGGLYAAFASRMRGRPLLLGVIAVNCASLLVLVTAHVTWVLFLGCAVFGMTSSVFGARVGVLSLTLSPESHRGRINGFQNTASMIVTPIAVFLAALAVSRSSVTAVGIAIVVAWAAVNLLFVLSRRVGRALSEASAPPA
ncbi:MFS transporter [Corynebacterium sp.]|uniref:MFS transporter n=1 Tax=Corynebacterium sp. TaxID=1720 RepID=UPI0026DAAB5D|nr:MFS transporter [Corynebacterium sp.]MDO4610648.1 MFS transporter [Corynebacterium sp.]